MLGLFKMSPAGKRLDSPYEPDSRYGKRSQTWRGYKVHVSETCESEAVHLITHVETTPAHIQDKGGGRRSILLPINPILRLQKSLI
ncbi:MAG: hypothetical protein HC930_09400 [Hydrococcus sp. SU_1_0]|nr:hypothetical protein [Hydrococcus sp. SU_1_0]